jgi:hypothetical protein
MEVKDYKLKKEEVWCFAFDQLPMYPQAVRIGDYSKELQARFQTSLSRNGSGLDIRTYSDKGKTGIFATRFK